MTIRNGATTALDEADVGYRCTVLDPPWNEKGGSRGADKHYDLIETRDMPRVILQSPLWSPAKNAHLWMWATANFVPDALWLMGALGFRYVSMAVWVKPSIGLGQYLRHRQEPIFLGVRGRLHTRDRGVDSVIEVGASLTAIWRLRADADERRREEVERWSLRLIGLSFLGLAAYVVFDALRSLIGREPPSQSPIGIGLTALSLIVMPLLARAKRRVAAALGSSALTSEAQQTVFCTYLSAIVLTGLVLNATLGWWWADPAAALAMTPFIVREGIDGMRGRACSDAACCP